MRGGNRVPFHMQTLVMHTHRINVSRTTNALNSWVPIDVPSLVIEQTSHGSVHVFSSATPHHKTKLKSHMNEKNKIMFC